MTVVDPEWQPLLDVVRSMLHPHELLSVNVDAFPAMPSGTGLPDPDLWLHVVVVGDRFDWGIRALGVVESDQERRDRLISALQDWIAESSFGWGEFRTPRDD